MKLFAIMCICVAAYLYFPLPQKRPSDRETLETQIKIETETRLASSSEILQALEIIRLGISSGITVGAALEYAQKHSPHAASYELEQVLNQFRVGLPLSHGLEAIAIANPGWRSITDTLNTSLQAGSPIADQLADIEFVLQSSIDTQKLRRIKSVAVKSVLPLGLCFLPAFILLAVIPIVAGLIGGITQ